MYAWAYGGVDLSCNFEPSLERTWDHNFMNLFYFDCLTYTVRWDFRVPLGIPTATFYKNTNFFHYANRVRRKCEIPKECGGGFNKNCLYCL